MNNSILERLAKLLPNMPSLHGSQPTPFERLPTTTPAMPPVAAPKQNADGRQTQPLSQAQLFRQDLAIFVEEVQPYIEQGNITLDAVNAILEERRLNAYAQFVPLLEQSEAAIDLRIEQTRQTLAPNQRDAYMANVDRETLLAREFLDMGRQHSSVAAQQRVGIAFEPHMRPKMATIEKLIPSYNAYQPLWALKAIAQLSGSTKLMALAEKIEKRDGTLQFSGGHNGLKHVQAWLSQLAVRHTSQSPAHLQQTVERHLSDVANNRKPPFLLNEAFFQELSKTKQYTDAEQSLALYNALSKNTNNALQVALVEWPLVSAMQEDDLRGYKNQHIARFVAENVLGHSACLPLEKTLHLERLLSIQSGQAPQPPIKYKSLTEAIPVERLSKILLHAHSVEVATPIVQAYQGERALDGSLRPENLVADVPAYLQTLLDASPQLQTGPKMDTPNAPITYGYSNSNN